MMNIIKQIDELETFSDLMKAKLDDLKKDLIREGKLKKKPKRKSSELVAKAKAKRAINRVSN